MDKDGNLNAKERTVLAEIQAKALDLGYAVISNKELAAMRRRDNNAACLTSALVRSRHAVITKHAVESEGS